MVRIATASHGEPTVASLQKSGQTGVSATAKAKLATTPPTNKMTVRIPRDMNGFMAEP